MMGLNSFNDGEDSYFMYLDMSHDYNVLRDGLCFTENEGEMKN